MSHAQATGLYWVTFKMQHRDYSRDILEDSRGSQRTCREGCSGTQANGWFLAFDVLQIGVTRIMVMADWVEHGQVCQ